MSETGRGPLPEYEKPPVVEVVYGVLFRPLELLLAPHLGLLWQKYASEYPKLQEVAPLPSIIESFEEVVAPATPGVEVSDKPPLPRVWFIRQDETAILQVQRDRFLHNWRKIRPEDTYPRYRTIIEVYKQRLSDFLTFLNENHLGTIEPLQYEMTYINHIPQGEGWESSEQIAKLFPDFSWRVEKRFLPQIHGMNWQTTFDWPNRAGRLRATIRRGVRLSDQRPTIMLELTARGIGEDRGLGGAWKWFEMAREWIVRGFADLTSDEVQRNIWHRLN